MAPTSDADVVGASRVVGKKEEGVGIMFMSEMKENLC